MRQKEKWASTHSTAESAIDKILNIIFDHLDSLPEDERIERLNNFHTSTQKTKKPKC